MSSSAKPDTNFKQTSQRKTLKKENTPSIPLPIRRLNGCTFVNATTTMCPLFQKLITGAMHADTDAMQCWQSRRPPRVTQVMHVQNDRLWNQYMFKSRQMRERDTVIRPLEVRMRPELHMHQCNRALNEFYLFHGTWNDKVDSICTRGFDARLGHSLHGLSINFSPSACRALLFPGCALLSKIHHQDVRIRTLIVARVLVGTPYYATESNPAMRRPPGHEREDGDEYKFCDSVVAKRGPLIGAPGDEQRHADIHIYDAMQIYPEYVLTLENDDD